MESTMTRSHLVAALIVACAFSPLALAIQAPLPTQPGLAQRTEIQYEKLRHLLEATLAIETRFQNAIVHLQDTYGDVEVGNLYQGIDLTTVDGIHTVRQRLNALRAKYDAFTNAKEQYWAEEDEQVRTSDLAEPLASQFRDSLSTNQTETIPNYRAWFIAMRAYAAAVANLLDFADSHLGNLKWEKKRLIAPDTRVATDLLPALKVVAETQRRCNETGRAALDSVDRTTQFIHTAMQELEKTIRRRDGT
jgi:hypothetical protein